MTAGNDSTLPPAMSRRELRERERAAASAYAASGYAAPAHAASEQPAAPRPDAASATPPPASAPHPRAVAVAHPAPRRTVRRSLASRLLSVAALASAGALVVGMSLPATALGVYSAEADADADFIAASVPVEGQQVTLADGADEAIAISRDDFEVKSWAQVLKDKYGSRSYAYTSTGTGAVRWPFPYTVPISSGYGARAKGCGGCSTDHKGIDFVPGAGAPIFAIADGVVVEHTESHWSFGNTVVLEHRIDGHVVQTRYAHMQLSSSPLQVGQSIPVGEFVGLVGSTGVTTAPHLHFEVIVDGAHVDPFTWLQAHAG